MEITEDERRTLLAEAGLLDLVADLATRSRRVSRRSLDELLRAVHLPEPHRVGHGPARVPLPRTGSWAG